MERNRRLTDEIMISSLGVGSWALGGSQIYKDITADQAVEALHYYVSEGGNFIDTAESYTNAEDVIGRFLKETTSKHEIVIATKTHAGGNRGNVSNIEASLDKSLKRIGRDYVDVYYFHSPPEEDDLMQEALDTMQMLKKKGKIRAVGGSIKGVNVTDATVSLCKKYIDTGKMDVIQLVYNMLRQQTNEVFDYAVAHKVALIGRTSLETGFLSGKYPVGHRFSEDDHRCRWNATYDMIAEYVEKIRTKYIGEGLADDALTSLALRFAMYPDAITDTIVGAKNLEQMKETISIIRKAPLEARYFAELEDMFKGKTHLFNTSNGTEKL
ncbi:MAG: aldo/keto reductase [Lachnospiraceae bacterium]